MIPEIRTEVPGPASRELAARLRAFQETLAADALAKELE